MCDPIFIQAAFLSLSKCQGLLSVQVLLIGGEMTLGGQETEASVPVLHVELQGVTAEFQVRVHLGIWEIQGSEH